MNEFPVFFPDSREFSRRRVKAETTLTTNYAHDISNQCSGVDGCNRQVRKVAAAVSGKRRRHEFSLNDIGGSWVPAQATGLLEVTNPANGKVVARVPLSARPTCKPQPLPPMPRCPIGARGRSASALSSSTRCARNFASGLTNWPSRSRAKAARCSPMPAPRSRVPSKCWKWRALLHDDAGPRS